MGMRYALTGRTNCLRKERFFPRLSGRQMPYGRIGNASLLAISPVLKASNKIWEVFKVAHFDSRCQAPAL
jgi:hypothetical protein